MRRIIAAPPPRFGWVFESCSSPAMKRILRGWDTAHNDAMLERRYDIAYRPSSPSLGYTRHVWIARYIASRNYWGVLKWGGRS